MPYFIRRAGSVPLRGPHPMLMKYGIRRSALGGYVLVSEDKGGLDLDRGV
jgi:hypothetical protein